MRKPDYIIGDEAEPYLRRWWVIPRNAYFNIYLHQILKSDDPRALHDHPWWNISFILKGGYFEVMPKWYGITGRPCGVRRKWRGRFALIFRRATAAHRLEVSPGRPCWSLFITGRIVRKWGFWCPKGWRHWKEFVTPTEGGNKVGRGCDD
jgi:hypothetical protein